MSGWGGEQSNAWLHDILYFHGLCVIFVEVLKVIVLNGLMHYSLVAEATKDLWSPLIHSNTG